MVNISRSRLRVMRGWLLLVAMLITGLALASCSGGAPARGWSGPTLSGETLYVGSRDGRIVAINVTDGSLEWATPLETGTTSSGLGCARVPVVATIYGSPAVSDNLVYVGGSVSNTGKVYSFVPGESQPDRTLSTVRVDEKEVPVGSIVGSVTLGGGDVFFGGADGRVYGLNDRLQPIWPEPFKTEAKIWSTPSVQDGTVYIGSFDRNLYAIDASTGQEKWAFPANGVFVAAPLIDNGTVYAGSFDRRLYAIDAASGQEKWHFEAKQGFWAEPIIFNGSVYAASLDGKVYVLNAATGDSVAEIDLKSAISSSPALVGSTLVVATEQSPGNATEKAGAVLWTIDTTTYEATPLARLTGEKVYGPIAGGNGSVYAHTDRDYVYAVDVATGAVRQFNTK